MRKAGNLSGIRNRYLQNKTSGYYRHAIVPLSVRVPDWLQQQKPTCRSNSLYFKLPQPNTTGSFAAFQGHGPFGLVDRNMMDLHCTAQTVKALRDIIALYSEHHTKFTHRPTFYK
jgi:hypothetical protein